MKKIERKESLVGKRLWESQDGKEVINGIITDISAIGAATKLTVEGAPIPVILNAPEIEALMKGKKLEYKGGTGKQIVIRISTPANSKSKKK